MAMLQGQYKSEYDDSVQGTTINTFLPLTPPKNKNQCLE